MSDTKRLLVWLFVLVWCVLSLAFCRPGWAQQCGEDQLAANTIIIKKKAVSVAAAGGGCTLLTDSEQVNISGAFSSSDTYDSSTWGGQSFTLAAGITATAIQLYMYESTGVGSVTVSIQAATGGDPGVPSEVDVEGTVVTLGFADIPDSAAWTEFAFSSPVSIGAGNYFVVWRTTNATFYTYYGAYNGSEVGAYTSGTYPDGSTSTFADDNGMKIMGCSP